ncbi:MAG: hydrogen peroxide-inducible genes activator [Myxococcota bacterium]
MHDAPHPFSLRQLQYAVAVAETGAFGAAAERCAVSQPSLSAQVAKLEDALGVQLFERHPRGVLVTGAGEALIAAMRQILARADALAATAANLADPDAVVLRVGIIPTAAPYLLPPAVERLRTGPPRVHWLELQTEVCEQQLAEGLLDAIVIADPPTHAGTTCAELGWEPFLLVVPADQPLDAPVTVEQVAGMELLLLDDGHCLRDQTLALCGRPGARESPYRATSLPTMVQMVASSLGVSVIPASAVPVETARAGVRAVPFAEASVGRTLRLCWRTRGAHADRMPALAAVLGEALRAATR